MENKLIAKGTTTNLNSYTFNGIKDEPIIVITEDGFKYKGELEVIDSIPKMIAMATCHPFGQGREDVISNFK
jgi:hypothetical protein